MFPLTYTFSLYFLSFPLERLHLWHRSWKAALPTFGSTPSPNQGGQPPLRGGDAAGMPQVPAPAWSTKSSMSTMCLKFPTVSKFTTKHLAGEGANHTATSLHEHCRTIFDLKWLRCRSGPRAHCGERGKTCLNRVARRMQGAFDLKRLRCKLRQQD